MKKIFKIFLIASALCFSACDALDDNLTSPVSVSPDIVAEELLYNNIQLSVAGLMSNIWYYPASMTRMIANTSSYQYVDASSPNSFNGIWNTVYEGIWPDIDVLVGVASDKGLLVHEGTAKIMKAYTMLVLVDLFGDVPYSEAINGLTTISPKADSGKDIYIAALTLLDEAIAILDEAGEANKPQYDNFYAGDLDKWKAFANTLKLRAAVTTRLIAPEESRATINSLIGEELIDTESEDFQFSFGTTRDNPNSRHPNYNNSYETSDGAYMSNYYMWLLRAEKLDGDGNPIVDPRIRYYFYRQVEKADEQDVTVYGCHFSSYPDPDQKPSHYDDVDPRLPYCVAFLGDGYLGRDHLNSEGIPPDGPIRTIYGLYPFGGLFDESSYEDQQQSGVTGAKGQGVWPIMLSSYVDFLRAEAALTLGTNDDARTLLQSGMEKSIEKVQGFSSRDELTFNKEIDQRGELISVKDAYVPDEETVTAYIDHVLSTYDEASADGKLDIVMKEYYIALWGNGIEAYNMYRRTGKPNNMAPSLEPTAGEFMRSFLYPAVNVDRNGNAEQKTITVPVFWDDESIDLY